MSRAYYLYYFLEECFFADIRLLCRLCFDCRRLRLPPCVAGAVAGGGTDGGKPGGFDGEVAGDALGIDGNDPREGILSAFTVA